MNRLFLDALNGTNHQRAPVWLMRQAGRYMPSYQKLRQTHSLGELFHSSRLIADITKLPIDELGVDAAIVFADILLVLEELGAPVDFTTSPKPQYYGSSPKQLLELLKRQQHQFSYLTKGIEILKKELDVPLIGFSGGPLTVLSYFFEKSGRSGLDETKKWAYREFDIIRTLIELLTEATIHYLSLQIKAGVDAIQIFDSWAGDLDEYLFTEVVIPSLKRIFSFLEEKNIPSILFMRNLGAFLPKVIELPLSAISIDSHRSLKEYRDLVPEKIALQGNFDPHLLYAPKEVIKKKIESELFFHPRMIVNLSHGIAPDMPYEAVRLFVNTVKYK